VRCPGILIVHLSKRCQRGVHLYLLFVCGLRGSFWTMQVLCLWYLVLLVFRRYTKICLLYCTVTEHLKLTYFNKKIKNRYKHQCNEMLLIMKNNFQSKQAFGMRRTGILKRHISISKITKLSTFWWKNRFWDKKLKHYDTEMLAMRTDVIIDKLLLCYDKKENTHQEMFFF